MGHILIGISSWSDESLLKSGFYPEDITTPADRLRYYATNFTIAELDSSYHVLPFRRNIALWLENTPDGFLFDVKAFSLLTQHPTPVTSLPRTLRADLTGLLPGKDKLYIHHLPDEAADKIWQAFAEAILPLQVAGKLGVVVFQFPPWFHFRKENLDYVARCKEKLPQYQLAVEFRTAGWLNEENREQTLRFLREQGLTLVVVDEPQGLKSSVPPLAEVTAPIAILRFHGRNREDWERKGVRVDEKFKYLYSEEELREWVPKILGMADKAKEVHVIFKNKYQDFAVRNARQMKQMLGL